MRVVEGDMQTKREILVTLGKKTIISNGQLSLEVNEWFVPIGEKYPALEKEYLEKLEPAENCITQGKIGALEAVRASWLTIYENIRTDFGAS